MPILLRCCTVFNDVFLSFQTFQKCFGTFTNMFILLKSEHILRLHNTLKFSRKLDTTFLKFYKVHEFWKFYCHSTSLSFFQVFLRVQGPRVLGHSTLLCQVSGREPGGTFEDTNIITLLLIVCVCVILVCFM